MIHIKNFDFSQLGDISTVKPNKKSSIEYINAPFTFDIETTSFFDNDGNKRALMYIFMFSLNGTPVYGREWSEFFYTLDQLKKHFFLGRCRQLVIYVHNLSYEFQFLQGRCDISNVFARVPRHPMKCCVNECFEFRCSYILSGLSLAKTAEQITIHNIQKMTGDLDYKLIRHQNTPLTAREMGYCEHDVQVLYWYILQEMRLNNNSIAEIPLTRTGYVRRYCYDHISENTNYKYYRHDIKRIAPTDKTLFTLMHKCFMGGYTHANCIHVDEICENVGSIDFTSSYPAQMVRHKFPMGRFIQVHPTTRKMFENLINRKACLIEIVLKDITAVHPTHIISASKCKYIENGVFDNGRIVSADKLYTYITDIDYMDILQFYNVGSIHVVDMWVTDYDYLPDEFVKCILDFFVDKTTLKGIGGKEQEYLLKKGMLNSAYGMTVTNPVNNECDFISGEWVENEVDINAALSDSYLKKYKQFLTYQWGVWVTAWARHELFKGVLKIGIDVVYCDTDSIKFLHPAKYKNWIDEYNAAIIADMYKRCDDLGISHEMVEPTTNKGIKTPLGVFDYEKTYSRFKTLGAKRYAFSYGNDDFNITVSGLNKKTCVPYIKWYCEQHNISPFDFFCDDMVIPAQWVHDGITDYPTGKNTLTYIDEPYTMKLTDYLGNTATVSENSYIHMIEQEYRMGLADEFINFLMNYEYCELSPHPNKPDFLKILPLERRSNIEPL